MDEWSCSYTQEWLGRVWHEAFPADCFEPIGRGPRLLVVAAVLFAVVAMVILASRQPVHSDDSQHFREPATNEQVARVFRNLQQKGLVVSGLVCCTADADGLSHLMLDDSVVGHLAVRDCQGKLAISSMLVMEAVAESISACEDLQAAVRDLYGGEWCIGDTTSSDLHPTAIVWRMTRPDDKMVVQVWQLIKGGQLLGLKVVRAPEEGGD